MILTAYHTTHPPYELRAIDTNWTGFDFKKVEGQFTNEETNATLKIRHKKDRQYAVSIGDYFVADGFMISPTSMVAEFYLLEFSENGKVLYLSGNRLQRIEFK